MALVTLNLKPTDKQLREFGLVALVMLSLIAGLLWWAGKIEAGGAAVFVASGAVVFVLGRIRAGLIRPVYQLMMLVTFPVGWIVSHTAMAIFFYGLITLMGLFFRLIGRDPLCLSYDRQAQTYWRRYRHKRNANDYFHQF